jgi:hypothetical protein
VSQLFIRGRFNRAGVEERGGDTSVRVTGVNPISSKLTGGATATLTGFNFRKSDTGAAPSVVINGSAASNVVVVDGNTITFTIPVSATTGVFDIVVTIDGNVGTLSDGFIYFAPTIVRVSPVYGPVAGGTTIKIYGANFEPTSNYRVRVGGSLCTSVVVLDSTVIQAVTPNHAIGFVDVELLNPAYMFSPAIFSSAIFNITTQPDAILSALRNAFQFTLLVRGEDIRRQQGISISESLGAPPSTCRFRVDGQSNAPIGGEKIQIRDAIDGNRLIWAGTVQSVKQVYEGKIDQLAWDTDCVDFTWLANRKRPVGSWYQRSATQVVKEIVAQCCPGFTTTHVQTGLGKITISLDGTDDLITVFNNIAAQIGGGHWYFDYNQDTHFFHRPSDLAPPIVPVDTTTVGAYCTLAQGAATPALVSYPDAFWAMRVQFVWDDGTLSGLSPWSNLVRFDGSKLWNITGIPTGPTSGTRTVAKRRLWVHRFSGITDPSTRDTIWNVRPFCEIPDNTTTAFTTFFGSAGASVATITDIAAGVEVPDGKNPNNPPAPAAQPSGNVSSQNIGNVLYWMSCYRSFRYAYLYRDGSVSLASPSSAPSGFQYMTRGYTALTWQVGNLTPGPLIGTNNDCIARFVWSCQGLPAVSGYSESWPNSGPGLGYGSGNPNYLLKDPDWAGSMTDGITLVPDNVTSTVQYGPAALGTQTNNETSGDPYYQVVLPYGSDLLDASVNGSLCCLGNHVPILSETDKSFTFTPDPVPSWPNTDGPYLEDDDPPADITNANTDLLFETAEGATAFTVSTNRSQVRNRIFVIGAGSTLTQNYVSGSKQLFVADITSFALGGGRLRIEDVANGITEFAEYQTLQQKDGIPYIQLKLPLSYQYSQNAVVYNHYQADDTESQKFMARTELDVNGNPTDGVHEYTISDSNLKTVWQLYMRAHAELELYAWPIVEINYSSRDHRHRIGQTVHVDMDDPPCLGDFLIQSVEISNVRDQGDAVSPVYTARASSIRYDLNDLLLQILTNNAGSGISVGGIANAGANAATQVGSGAINIFSNSPVAYGYRYPTLSTTTALSAWGNVPVNPDIAINFTSFGAIANAKTLPDGRRFGACCVGAGPGNANALGQISQILGSPGTSVKGRWIIRWPAKTEVDLSLNPNALNLAFGIGASILGVGQPSAHGVYLSVQGAGGAGVNRDHMYLLVISADGNTYFVDIGRIIQDSDLDILFEEVDTAHFRVTVTGLSATVPVPAGWQLTQNGSAYVFIVPYKHGAGESYFLAGTIMTNLVTTNSLVWVRRVEWSSN